MKENICLICFAMAFTCFARTAEEEHAINTGIDTKVVFKVINDQGDIVSNAFVKAGFYLNGIQGNAVHQYTGTNGLLIAEKKSVGEINYWINKVRHYETSGRFSFIETGVKDGRWQPYGMTNTVVLKRCVNPVAMYVRQGSTPVHRPKQGEFIGFDLEHGDWVSPHGKGKREDFQVLFNLDAKDELWLAFRYTLTFRFPKPFDGVYRMKKDEWSALKSTPLADTNRTYQTEIIFTSERRYDEVKRRSIVVNDQLKEDEYLVLRVRSETNEEGKLVKANYAKIYGSLFAAKYGLVMTSYFNPKENNASLEADPMKNLRDPNDLGFTP